VHENFRSVFSFSVRRKKKGQRKRKAEKRLKRTENGKENEPRIKKRTSYLNL
jgi:hypothetical protein